MPHLISNYTLPYYSTKYLMFCYLIIYLFIKNNGMHMYYDHPIGVLN